MRTIRAVLFDVDGVLLDSAAANAAFYRALFDRIGGTGPTPDEIAKDNHYSMETMLRRFYPDATDMQIHAWMELGDTLDEGSDLLQPMPGMLEVIPKLAEQYKLGIVTNRTTLSIDEIWKVAPFQKLFSAVAAYEDTAEHKPHPEPVQFVLTKLGVHPHEAIFVGDAQTDLAAGQAAGVPVIILGPRTWPGAAESVPQFADIPAAIDRIASR